MCALLVGALVAFAALVPIGRPSRTLDGDSAVGMLLGAATLAIWAIALGVQARWLAGVEAEAVVLTPSMSPGVFDLVFSLPFLVVVPLAANGLYAFLRGGAFTLVSLLCASLCLGLFAIRETDGQAYVRNGELASRKGWLWVRRVTVPVEEVRAVTVQRDTFRGAASFIVKLEVAEPALAGLEQRYRSEAEAEAEATRWRHALRPLRGAP
jgi:hypothetical protein